MVDRVASLLTVFFSSSFLFLQRKLNNRRENRKKGKVLQEGRIAARIRAEAAMAVTQLASMAEDFGQRDDAPDISGINASV